MMSIACTCTHGGGGHAEKCQLFVPSPENYAAVRAQRNNLEAQTKALLHDVNDIMSALRLVASENTSIETVRAIAKTALAHSSARSHGGWVPTEKGIGHIHGNCIRLVAKERDRMRLMLGAIKAWCSRQSNAAYAERLAMHGLGETPSPPEAQDYETSPEQSDRESTSEKE